MGKQNNNSCMMFSCIENGVYREYKTKNSMVSFDYLNNLHRKFAQIKKTKGPDVYLKFDNFLEQIDKKKICLNELLIPFVREQIDYYKLLQDFQNSNVVDKTSFDYETIMRNIMMGEELMPTKEILIVKEFLNEKGYLEHFDFFSLACDYLHQFEYEVAFELLADPDVLANYKYALRNSKLDPMDIEKAIALVDHCVIIESDKERETIKPETEFILQGPKHEPATQKKIKFVS